MAGGRKMVVDGQTGLTKMHRRADMMIMTDQVPMVDGGSTVMATAQNKVQRLAKRAGRLAKVRL